MRMHAAEIGTCNGCGLGVSLPNREPWRPGEKVVVMPEADLLALLRETRREPEAKDTREQGIPTA
jgi:hypothetical protein